MADKTPKYLALQIGSGIEVSFSLAEVHRIVEGASFRGKCRENVKSWQKMSGADLNVPSSTQCSEFNIVDVFVGVPQRKDCFVYTFHPESHSIIDSLVWERL